MPVTELSSVPSVADCLRQHGEEFLQQCGEKVTLSQRKVLSAIQRCRTGELGMSFFSVISVTISTGWAIMRQSALSELSA